MEVTSESRERLDSADLWSVQAGGHKDWLKNLCMALLDSGGVQNEALLLTRPLCEVYKTVFVRSAVIDSLIYWFCRCIFVNLTLNSISMCSLLLCSAGENRFLSEDASALCS